MRAAAHKGRYAGRTEHAGLGDTAVAPKEIIGKSDLMNQVSQGITVEEGSLYFHIANLRKMLGMVQTIFEVHPRERCSLRKIGATKQ